jgi:hypothetical protein
LNEFAAACPGIIPCGKLAGGIVCVDPGILANGGVSSEHLIDAVLGITRIQELIHDLLAGGDGRLAIIKFAKLVSFAFIHIVKVIVNVDNILFLHAPAFVVTQLNATTHV